MGVLHSVARKSLLRSDEVVTITSHSQPSQQTRHKFLLKKKKLFNWFTKELQAIETNLCTKKQKKKKKKNPKHQRQKVATMTRKEDTKDQEEIKGQEISAITYTRSRRKKNKMSAFKSISPNNPGDNWIEINNTV